MSLKVCVIFFAAEAAGEASGSDLWPHRHAEVVQGWEKSVGSSEAGLQASRGKVRLFPL